MQKVSLLMLGSFLAVQLGAWVVGVAFLAFPPDSPFTNANDLSNSALLFGFILASAVVMLLILKYYRGNLLFVFFEALIIFSSLQILFLLFLPFLAATVLAFLLMVARFLAPRFRPAFLAVTTAIVGALLGSWLGLLPAAVLAALLAVYDIAAVFFTKHMITLARGLTDRGASFSIAVSAPSGKSSKRAKKRSTPFSRKPGPMRHVDPRTPLESLELGTGDLVIPAMLIVSALHESLSAAAAAFVGAGIGFLALLYILERHRGFWPALPPIVGGTLGTLLIWLAVKGALGIA